MPLVQDQNRQVTVWILIALLLLSWGDGLLAAISQSNMSMGEGSHRVSGDNQHCQMPAVDVLQQDCGCGCASLQQTLPRRGSAIFGSERIDQPTLLVMDSTVLLPVRGPPRDVKLFISSTIPIPIPPRLSFCCLRI
ncbi:MAG: hypothetical protein KZQ89_20455 [Candidatus Thiodiazotropha sp. (ex Lucinoma kastoroae)]|nr:hypothetical protein [Candidatus Thiodiazotropha sp. (ex Rostrolucina anterorostrata)]MCU7850308.1 hypothetical protein [Candidatus Thiodiazotropha sp. (ex Lucinoma kastoroae)]MCU7859555.1 hypothetical protein [Candidatus Thiodiazotropha sp. (ex Lucinoma kastoroae)]